MFWFISTACFKSNSVNTVNTHYCLLTVNYILLYLFLCYLRCAITIVKRDFKNE
jgi:hypothetical protein